MRSMRGSNVRSGSSAATRRVLAGSLTDTDRVLIFNANRLAKPILVAAEEALMLDTRGPSGRRGRGQYVGIPQDWTHDALVIGSISGSFTTEIPWLAIRGVWLCEDAPPEEVVNAECFS